MTTKKIISPTDNQGDQQIHLDGESSSILPDPTGLVAGCYVAVVQVRGTNDDPRYRRRVMFNLPSAQKAVDRATMAGLDASIVLCRLIPAGGDK